MFIRLTSESRTLDFTTPIDGCLSFSIENQGTSTFLMKIDDAEFELPANTAREFGHIPGCIYAGEIHGVFMPASALETNKVLVIKSTGYCQK